MPKVLISDKLSNSAVEVFKKLNIETDYKPGINEIELLNIIHNYDGLAIRSATNVTKEIFEKGNINLNKEIIDGGANISGGQKQRLLIIRELLKNPKLIIFDEGLGSLENKNKIEILKNIKELYPDLTILNFTHDSFFKEISDVVIEL